MAYNSLGLSLPLFGSYTGIETSVIPLSIMKSRNLVSANITCSGSIVFLSLTLVTRKHRYLPGTCATDGGSAAIPPSPGLCLNRNSTFWYSLLKSASNLDLKLMSAVMQIALVLFDRMKSLSVIMMFSEYSLGISNFVLKFRPIVGSGSSSSSSNSLVSLTSLSFFIIKFSVWVSPTPTPRTKYLSTSPSMLSGLNCPEECPVACLLPSIRKEGPLSSCNLLLIHRLAECFVLRGSRL